MKILITGAAGFIGFHLVNRLISEEFQIVGLDNINDYYDVNLKYARLKEKGICISKIKYGKVVQSRHQKNYEFIKLNLEDNKQINLLFENKKFDIVINLEVNDKKNLKCYFLAKDSFAYEWMNVNSFASPNIEPRLIEEISHWAFPHSEWEEKQK